MDLIAFTGFRQSQDIFNMFLNLDNVLDIDTVKKLCSKFEENLRDATQGDGQFCPKRQVQLLTTSYEVCVPVPKTKTGGKAPP